MGLRLLSKNTEPLPPPASWMPAPPAPAPLARARITDVETAPRTWDAPAEAGWLLWAWGWLLWLHRSVAHALQEHTIVHFLCVVALLKWGLWPAVQRIRARRLY